MTATTARAPLFLACMAILSSSLVAPAGAADWPSWRGPNRDGKSTETGLLKTWSPEGPALEWKASGLGSGYASVTVVDSMLYTAGVKSNRTVLLAFDLNGKPRWSRELEGDAVKRYPGSRSTPTFDSGLLYIETDMGKFGCYSADDGSEKWTRLASEFGGKMNKWGFSESPLVVGDLVIFTPGGTNCMVALDKKTGKAVWGSEAFGGAHYCSPILVETGGVRMVINGTSAGLVAVDVRDGRKLWSNDFSASNTANCTTPAYSDGRIFWSNGYGRGAICLKLEVKDGVATATEAWRTKDMESHHGGYIVKDGFIYGNHRAGWSCLDLATGQVQWNEASVGKGSLCYADGMLFLFGEGGGRVAIGPASPEGFKPVATFAVQGTGPSWAHPVVAAGRLFLRYDDNLYAYTLKARK